ncbi:LOW QUALITY PROTEIN: autophagy protein 5-like, partial [Cimex lectularius]|uniref:Autophagy protein 5 n=1 Tax=Cimex lectularius TaxID=79782 RepID=A0A8I6SRY8_CIMLE
HCFRHYPIGVLFDIFESDIQLPWVINVRFDNFPEQKLLHCPSKEYVESHFLSSLKKADVMKHKTQIVTNMQKKDHRQLCLGLQNDKFDQFWAVNRKLMESGPDECFKNIPFKLYFREEHYVQKLVKPVHQEVKRKTFGDFINEVVPASVDMSSFKILIHGIEVPHETPLQWMSEHLSYPDNFLHFVISSKCK